MARCLAVVLLLAAVLSVKAELPLPPNLIALSSHTGEKMLLEAKYKSDYFRLAEHFVTQINSAFCGVASSAMCLNALETPRPMQDPASHLNTTDYEYYTQDNVFNADTEKVVAKAHVQAGGMDVEQLAGFLAAHPGVSATYQHTGAGGLDVAAFRQAALKGLALPAMFVIVNFDRALLGERGGGHHSPVAAYHEATDSFLVLDVSRYKYPAWWVKVSELWTSTSGSTDSSTHTTRGLAFVWASDRYPSTPQPLQANSIPQDTDNGDPVLIYQAAENHMGGEGDGAGLVVARAVFLIVVITGIAAGFLAALFVYMRHRRMAAAAVAGGSGYPMDCGAAVWPGMRGYRAPGDDNSAVSRQAAPYEDEMVTWNRGDAANKV